MSVEHCSDPEQFFCVIVGITSIAAVDAASDLLKPYDAGMMWCYPVSGAIP